MRKGDFFMKKDDEILKKDDEKLADSIFNELGEKSDSTFSDAKGGEMERNDKEQRERIVSAVEEQFDELLTLLKNENDGDYDEKDLGDFLDSENLESEPHEKKKRKKRRNIPLDFAVVNGAKKIKKINKKSAKNSQEIASDFEYVDETPSKNDEKSDNKLKSNQDEFIQNDDIEFTNETQEKSPKNLENSQQIFVAKKSQKNSEKIQKNSPQFDTEKKKAEEKSDDKNAGFGQFENISKSEIGQSKADIIKENDTRKSDDKRVFFVAQTSPAQEKEIKDLRAENETLKKENLALKREKNARKEKGFYYAEILTNKSRKDKQRDEQLASLQEERTRENEKRKQEDLERKEKEEKTHDIIRQRKDIQYGLDYIQRKADMWRNVSEDAYQNAMMSLYTNLGNPANLQGKGLAGYSTYMALSLRAMRYSLDYQHDLEVEREKMLQKERELDRLMQR